MAKRRNFHPDLINDVLNDTLPKELKHLIKSYHKTKWKVNKPMYIGSEYYETTKEKTYKKQYLKCIAQLRMLRLKIELSKPNKKLIKTKGNEKRIIQQIKKSERYLCLSKCCELLGLKRKTFMRIQALNNARECTPEIYLACNKRKKNQLTTQEVYAIKDVLQDTTQMAWPITRLHLKACQQGLVSACYNSWLHVKNLFEINRNPIRPFKSKNKKGIRGKVPNALIHSDVCRFVLKLNEKNYLFLSMDNHSKYILNAAIANKINKTINVQHFLDTMRIAEENQYPVLAFMTDQGTESDNREFTKAVENYGITHLLAQTRATPVSNSMVERMFASIRKYIRVKFQNLEITTSQLKKAIAEFVKIHNFELPLYNSKKTPSELYWQVTSNIVFNFKDAFSKAIVKRKEDNTLLKCFC